MKQLKNTIIAIAAFLVVFYAGTVLSCLLFDMDKAPLPF
jgi:hypothetical protein